ncbi:MAG: glycosyltransferase family 4 protein, partial [Alphaproteobacteria bacterium]|nr:glycosyltransferase family 4 protein [Alphaproteobacteria bacterium]
TVTADYYKGIPGGGYQSFVSTDHLSGAQLVTLRDQLEAEVRDNTLAVIEAAAAFRPDAVIVGNVDCIGMDYIQPLLDAGIPVIHSLGTQRPSFPPERTPRHPLYRPAPASRWVGEEMIAQGHPMERWTVLYPGARTQHFYRLFPPECDRLRILYAGLLLPYKGPQVLLNALFVLASHGVDFTCTLAGDSTDPAFVARMRRVCDENLLADRISFVGFQDRAGLARLFDSHNVFVFPSIVLEAFGIVQVEAMAAGLACVTTATGGGREIVRDGVDGLLVPSSDSVQLADLLCALRDEPTKWRRLQTAGRERALTFSVERSVDVLEDAIEELAAQAREGGRDQHPREGTP